MIKVFERIDNVTDPAQLSVCLPFDERKKSRLKTTAENGEPLGFMLPRGQVLRNGTLLRDETGRIILVKAASECLSVVRSECPILLMRAAYHLGNRHVPLQVSEGLLSYQHDHVLDDMVRGLGLTVTTEQRPFEPEDGAYAAAGHAHGHGHVHEDGSHHGHHHEH